MGPEQIMQMAKRHKLEVAELWMRQTDEILAGIRETIAEGEVITPAMQAKYDDLVLRRLWMADMYEKLVAS